MMLLDAFMDALSSLFPDLSRTLPARGGSERPAPVGGVEGSGDGGFAATLFQFLGGRSAALPSGASRPTASGTPGAAAEEGASGGAPEGSASQGPQAVLSGGIALGGHLFPAGDGATTEPGAHGPWQEVEESGAAAEGGHSMRMGVGEPPSEETAEADGESASDAPAGSSEGRPATDPTISGAGPAGVAPGSVAGPSRPAPMGAADRDLEKLDPVLRDRLERVVERMESEFGHRVEVVEGYRSPQRQDALYRQGRSEGGPVVTWTRQSLHSQGRAVDVQVDGSWETQEGYARLQQVAREEGLATLGARDPGHLELPEGEGERLADSGFGPGDRSGFRSSRPARPARVANAATVARVARVARPGWGGTRSAEPRPGAAGTPVGAESAATRAPQSASAPSAVTQGGPGMRMPPASAPSGDAPVLPEARLGAPVSAPFGDAPVLSESRVADPAPRPSADAPVLPDGRMAAPRSAPVVPAIPAPERMAEEPGVRAVPLRPDAAQESPGLVSRQVASAPAAAAPQLMARPMGRDRRRSGINEEFPGTPAVSGDAAGGTASRTTFSVAPEAPVHSQPGAPSPPPLQGVATVERIDRIQALEDALDVRVPGRIHLELDDVDGAGTRLRLALRGTQLDGSVGLSDPEAALRMRARIGELHEALSRRGLDARTLDLHSLSATSPRADADPLLSLRDPLAALARMAEPREGGTDPRSDRGWTQQRDEGGREPREHRDPARRNRSKEEGR